MNVYKMPWIALATLVWGRPATAQQATSVPVRPIGPVMATTADSVGRVADVRALRGGGVLVNDVRLHRVLLYDPSLTHARVVVDTASQPARSYGVSEAAMLPMQGDSTLFVDQVSLAMLVIDPAGRIARTIAVPRPADIRALVSDAAYVSACANGNECLIYSQMVESQSSGPMSFSRGVVSRHDSAVIVRVDMVTHHADTVAAIRLDGNSTTMRTNDDGKMVSTRLVNPLPRVDDWTVTVDGSIALIRGDDFHIDWIRPDGAHVSTPKIPYEWQRLTDSAKAWVVDSVKAFYAALPTSYPSTMGGTTRTIAAPPPPEVVDASQLPDYRPAFTRTAGIHMARPDMDGNLWIAVLPTSHVEGGTIYDVINRDGALTDRVQLPPGFGLVGFGPGVAYATSRDGPGAASVLSRIRIRQ